MLLNLGKALHTMDLAILKKHGHGHDSNCPLCGGELLHQQNSWICENHPKTCSFVKPDAESDHVTFCEKCGKKMVVRSGKFGRFLACSGFPECSYTRPFELQVDCPSDGCLGKVIERTSKNGKMFFGCNQYPACNFMSWQEPVNAVCPKCSNHYLVKEESSLQGAIQKCPKCNSVFESLYSELSSL